MILRPNLFRYNASRQTLKLFGWRNTSVITLSNRKMSRESGPENGLNEMKAQSEYRRAKNASNAEATTPNGNRAQRMQDTVSSDCLKFLEKDTKENMPEAIERENALEEARQASNKVIKRQAPNRIATWASMQEPRDVAMSGPRFELMDLDAQPQPQAAIELIANVPIQFSDSRIVSCDGGKGALGHPKVFINLDKPGPKPCPYCGIRFQMEPHTQEKVLPVMQGN